MTTPGTRRLMALALCAAALGACTRVGTAGLGERANPKTEPHVLRYANLGDVSSPNPLLMSTLVLAFMSQMTLAWLIRYDHSHQPIPELATVVPTLRNGGISPDGKTITFHL